MGWGASMADLLEIIGADAGLKFGAESPPEKNWLPPPPPKKKTCYAPGRNCVVRTQNWGHPKIGAPTTTGSRLNGKH